MPKNFPKELLLQYDLTKEEILVYSYYYKVPNATISQIYFLISQELNIKLDAVEQITYKLEDLGFLRKIEGNIDRWVCIEPYLGLFIDHTEDFISKIQKFKDDMLSTQSKQFEILSNIKDIKSKNITDIIKEIKDILADFTLFFLNEIDDACEIAERNEKKLEEIYNASMSISEFANLKTWQIFGREALFATIKDMISRSKSSITITMPTFAPEILQYISEFAYEKKAVNFIVNSYWDENVFGEIVKKMEMFGNIKFQKLSQPGEYYASIKDAEEVILAPLTDSNEELISLISTQQNYVQLVSQIILPMLNIRSPSIERREIKKIKVRRPKFEKRSREKIHQEMDSIMDFKPKKKVSGGNSVLAFVSYAIKDSTFFRIGELVENLKFYEKIEDVLYCEKDTRDNFVKYMNKYVGECDVMILFCSPPIS